MAPSTCSSRFRPGSAGRGARAKIRTLFVFAAVLSVLCVGADRTGRAQAVALPPLHAPGTAFRPRSFGVNIDSALVNPLDGTASEADLRQEVAVIMHDVRAIGGTTGRWFVNDVWPQWRCSKDPENQATGEIDPGWFIVTRTLLEQAQRADVKVDVVLGDLANGSIGFNGVSASPPADLAGQMHRWAEHRAQMAGKDGYRQGGSQACSGQAGYYGTTRLEDLFTRPDARAHLLRRYTAMARFLSRFPALGAVELFNEPDFKFTHTANYWSMVRELEAAVHGVSPRMASVPVISGTAWWDAGIAHAAAQAGVLAQEPFITAHSYLDYSKGSAQAELRGLIDSLHRIVPGKELVISEAGSKTPLRSRAENREMVRTLIDTYVKLNVGVWVWGDWFPTNASDFKQVFNARSPAGASFRDFFFSPQNEKEYAKAKTVTLDDQGKPKAFPVAVSQIPDSNANPQLQGLFELSVGDIHFTGFSRAGVFPQPFPGRPALFAPPPPTFFISNPKEALRWAEIEYGGHSWTLHVFGCETGQPGGTSIATPEVLLGLAATRKRADFASCAASRPLISGKL